MEIANVQVAEPADVPLRVLIPAFVTSELKTAFQIGFMLFLPSWSSIWWSPVS